MQVLRVTDFPGCCKAKVLHGFGDCNHDHEHHPEDVIEADVREAIETQRRNGQAFLVAIVTDQQERIHPILRRNGFGRCRKWADKGGPHAGEVKLRLYYHYLQEGV